MRLISARIENFGKLHDVDIDFDEGLNVFLRENGYGKSTLASFIRVMFYGLSGERKFQDAENDRKKFRPWQGGAFGGELVFSVGDGIKKYRIERSFGEKKSQDIFRLFDAETNLETTDYTDNLGEEILKIDERSFRKTVFIGQQELETGITSQINAKIGNLSEDRDDMNRYEAVVENLKDEINSLSPNRRTGDIFKKRMELEIINSELREKESLEQEFTTYAEKLHDAGEEQRRLSRTIESLNSRILELSRYQDLIKEKMSYDNLAKEISDSERRLMEAQRRHFGAAFETITAESRNGEINRGLRELDERFKCGIPDEKDLYTIEKRIAKVQFLREKLSLMEQDPHGYTGDFGIGVTFFSYILAVILLFSGGYLILSDSHTFFGVVMAAVGAAVAIIRTVSISARGNYNRRRRPQGMDEISDEIERLCEEIASFFSKYYPRYDFSDAYDLDFEPFRGFGNDILRYNRLCDIREFARELTLKRKEKAQFESTHDMDRLRDLNFPSDGEGSFESLSERLNEQTLKFNEITESIHGLKSRMKISEDKLRLVFEKERRYESGLQELHEMEQRYNLLLLVRDHLEEAHNSFTKAYLSPLMEAFKKYYSMFINVSGLEEVPYRMDASFNVNLVSEGQSHSTGLLSAGFRNMVELSRRMAFVDAMYEAEKPFIILDDPFVNLDEEKVEGAMKFLNEIAKTYQVIYFTCHESRK
ncbi:ATP-binding protein [Oribacterium sp. C9]|uniref:ATP-binding protein n=1 Tax=Oribacterium sp. C9 TaxID=1943579 RepID=UPI0011159572|nr:ATP-binding protein [Oribacterium sp. C9]